MNRKILSTAVVTLVTVLVAPLALAEHGERNEYREVRVHQVEERYSSHDNGLHRGWYKEKHKYKKRHQHASHHDYYERREYREYSPRVERDDDYPPRRSSSSTPIILGSVIGGVVGHELGRGDPRDTAVGAVVGTIIGYQIVRNRD